MRRLLERASAQPGGVEALVADLEARRTTDGAPIEVALAALWLARADVARARASLEAALASDGQLAVAHALLARVVVRAGGTNAAPEAVASLRRAVQHAPDAHTRAGYQRDLASLLLDTPEGLEEVRTLYTELARGGSSTARTELARLLVARGRCEEARAELEVARRAVAADASAVVGLALLRAQCEQRLQAPEAAWVALGDAWSHATRSGRTVELLDAMVTVARDNDGLARLEVELAGRGPLASLHRGIVLEELGREEDALRVLREVLRRSPRDVETRQRVARLLARHGRLAEALDEQRTLARLFPERIALTMELAQSLRDQGFATEALAVLDRARARAARDRSSLFLLVDAYARAGARDRVLQTLEAIVRAAPQDPRGVVALANELLTSPDPLDRERALLLVERVGGARADVRGQLEVARALANLRVFEGALAHLEQASELAPDAPEVLDAQAEIFERAGRGADAERALERRAAQAAASDDPAERLAGLEAETRLVASWARHASLPQHRAPLEAAHHRGDASAGRMLVELLRRQGEVEAAQRVLSQLLEAHPSDAHLVASAARLAHERSDYEGEVRALQRLAELEPARAGWHLSRLVELALATYRDDDAVRFAQDASQRSIDDAGLFVRLGRLHARRRDTQRAADAYARALAIDPDEHEAAWELASLERDRGEVRRAMELQLSILERARDDELRERAGRAVLESARAEGLEGTLEPRLLSLALARGDAPVFRRLALALYGSLSSGARARGDVAELERWVGRALPVLLAALRDSDLGTRATARQLLFTTPVPAASTALLALAADASVEPTARLDALLAALHVVGPRDVPALRALLTGSGEQLAISALHGLVGLLAPAERTRLLTSLAGEPGRLAEHTRALSLLTAPAARPTAATRVAASNAATAQWLTAWQLAASGAPLTADDSLQVQALSDRALTRGRDETAHAVAFELAVSGAIDDSMLDRLAQRALTERDETGALAMRVLTTRSRPSWSCAPALARAESLEGWLARVIEACPRAPRAADAVSAALVRTVAALPEASLVRALSLVARELGRSEPATHDGMVALFGPTASALAARTLPIRAASPEAGRALVSIAEHVPSVLPDAAWGDLLQSDDRGLRVLAVGHAPAAVSRALLEVAHSDGAWTVRRAALQRLAQSAAMPGPPLERSAYALAVSAGLLDPIAFVRSAALGLAVTLDPTVACASVTPLREDADAVVAQEASAIAARVCAP